jgi:hypothetical protein
MRVRSATRSSRWSTSSRHLPRRAVESSQRQVGLASRSAGDGQRVDRVGPAGLAGAAPDTGHHLRRDAHDLLSGTQQRPLERAREMPAVLQCPTAVGPSSGPHHRRETAVRGRAHGPGRRARVRARRRPPACACARASRRRSRRPSRPSSHLPSLVTFASSQRRSGGQASVERLNQAP